MPLSLSDPRSAHISCLASCWNLSFLRPLTILSLVSRIVHSTEKVLGEYLLDEQMNEEGNEGMDGG